jgi:outer membrane protein TolC
MNVRFRSWLPASGLLFVVLGCASLDRRPEPMATSVVPRNRDSLDTDQHFDAQRTSAIRRTTFEEPEESNSGDSSDLFPTALSHDMADATGESRTIQETLNPPVVVEVVAAESTVIDLDLTRALALAVGQNPRITFAAARYREAYARLESAQTLWLPSIRAGLSFNHHDGTLQASSGEVLDVSRSSLQAGLGVQAVGAGTPAVPGVAAVFHTSDAFFQPKIAAHVASARDALVEATTNDTMLATALAYLDLLRTTQRLRIAEETRANAEKLTELTASFARSGQGPQADADRARTELVRRRNDVSRAQESTRVATARLAELLSLGPFVEIKPEEPTIVPIDLVSLERSAADLVATGLVNRPELAEAQYLVCETVYRYRREKYAPLLPSVLLALSQSGFGGGFGSNIDNDRGRFDFDASVYWELRNFGLGERAKRNATWSQYDQARALQVSVMDRVAREVVEAHWQVQSRKGQIEVAESGVKWATNSYQRNLARIREGHGLPIEVLQSLQALDEARREYLRTLADYNEAQFRLQRALGWPID